MEIRCTESSDTVKPFNFCRLTKIDGGVRFTIVLTSQFDVYVAGVVRRDNPTRKNGFVKLDLSERIGTAHVNGFSCSFFDALFIDSMKRVFTLSELMTASQDPCFLDASILTDPMITASAKKFHVIDALSGRLFNLELRLLEQRADSNCFQILVLLQGIISTFFC